LLIVPAVNLTDFSQAISTGLVISGRHATICAKQLCRIGNTLVVCCNDDFGGAALYAAFIDMLQHRFSRDVSQRLSR
jgi:hypothetical protein